MTTIGEVDESGELVIQWEVENFFSLPSEVGTFYNSPLFSFANASWCLQMYPNCEEEDKGTDKCINLYLHRKCSGPPVDLEYALGVKIMKENIGPEEYLKQVFDYKKSGFGYVGLLNRTELLEKKSHLAPSDILTFVCKIKGPKPIEVASVESLCQNYKNVLLDGCNHDLILMIGDREFRAHRDVLSARSPVFKSMLTHNMVEKNSGVIDVPDCDPNAMEQFLSYIYSAKVESLNESNMLELYYIADKYDMKDLKEECSKFIRKSLSATNFCKVIQLALNHCDSSLHDFASEYFINNVLDILHSVEWQTFMKDNLTVANKLIIKSHEKKK